MSFVVPAVLPSSRKDLEEKLSLFSKLPSITRVQIDIVDGKFANPPSWPYTAPKELRAMVSGGELFPHLDRIQYEVDLMCMDAESAAGAFLSLGATRLTFHAESTTNLPKLIASVKNRFGAGAEFVPGLVSFGLALNITSDLALIEPCIGDIAFVQFMGIAKIGRQGQPFDRRVYEKVRVFRSRHPNIPVQVDGGVSLQSAKELCAAGVSSLVVGSALLRASDPAAFVAEFEALENPFGV